MSCVCCSAFSVSLEWQARQATGVHGGRLKAGEDGVVYTRYRELEAFVGGIIVREYLWEGPLTSIDGDPEIGSFVLDDTYIVSPEDAPEAGPYGSTESLTSFPAEVKAAAEGKSWEPIGGLFPLAHLEPSSGSFAKPIREPSFLWVAGENPVVAACAITSSGTNVLAIQARMRLLKTGHYTPVTVRFLQDAEEVVWDMPKAQTERPWHAFEIPDATSETVRVLIGSISVVTPPWG